MGTIKYILAFVLFFFLHYIEGLPPLAGLSIAQLWKLPILLVLIICLFVKAQPLKKFERFGYLFSIEPFLSLGILSNPMSVFLFSVKQLPLILFFNFWQRLDVVKLEKYLLWFAQFVCLASFITLLGIIEPLKAYGSADGFMEGLEYYSSVFGAPHSASSYFAVASIVIIFFFMRGKFNTKKEKLFNGLLLLIALYSLYLAYVRTGWLMLLVSLFFLIDFKKNSFKTIYRIGVITCVIGLGLTYLYLHNEAFRLRVSGGGQYRGESEYIVDISGSGRMDFWKNGISLWLKSDVYPFFMGLGYDDVIQKNYEETGMTVFSHNFFVDTLAQYGLCGLLLLFAYYSSMFFFIKKHKRGSPFGNLCVSIFAGLLIFNIFQSEIYFNYAIFFSLSLVLMYKTNTKTTVINEEMNSV